MAYDEELAERVRAALDDVTGVNEIKMFGGLCFTVGGNMAVGVSHDDLLVRPRLANVARVPVGGARGDDDRPEAARVGRSWDRVRVFAPAEETQDEIQVKDRVAMKRRPQLGPGTPGRAGRAPC